MFQSPINQFRLLHIRAIPPTLSIGSLSGLLRHNSSRSAMSSLAADLPLPPAPEAGNSGTGTGTDAGVNANTGVASIPRLVYGTAWKKDRSADLVAAALSAGFRGIDTAAQPKHYREELVGQGIRAFLSSSSTTTTTSSSSSSDPQTSDGRPLTRSSLYIQTKFTPSQQPDPSLPPIPYDTSAPLEDQISSSIASSLRNLSAASGDGDGDDDAAPYLDCLLLHSPLHAPEETLHAWRVLESQTPHPLRRLGISNVSAPELAHLVAHARVKPSVVQNRFHPREGFAADVRRICDRHGIVFQSFWTLTANPALLKSRLVADVASAAAGPGVHPETVVYALVLALGRTCVLDGTTSEEHMRGDLAGIRRVESWAAGEGRETWDAAVKAFRSYVDADFVEDD